MKRIVLQAVGSVAGCLFLLVMIALGTDALSKAAGVTQIYGRPIKPPALTADGKVPTPGREAVPYAHPPFPTYTPTSTPTGSPPATYTPTRTATPTPTATCGPGWNIVDSPNGSPENNRLNGVAAISENDVWAVGSQRVNGSDISLAEHWNGAYWAMVPPANPTPTPGNTYHLSGVDAVASNDVWAVGDWWDGYNTLPLAFHWDGSEWIFTPSVGPGGGETKALSVSGTAGNDVWAVGSYWRGSGYPTSTFTMHWDGRLWSVVPSPNGGSNTYNILYGVSAVAPNDVWAVGFYLNGSTSAPLILHWDGSAWSVDSSPQPANASLYDVSARAADDAWVVGLSPQGTLTEHWNGTQWSVVPSPNINTGDLLVSVDSVASDDVWAVGYYTNYLGTRRTLTLHWNGTQWSVVASPNVSTIRDNFSFSVSAVSASTVWAVGSYIDVPNERTFTMRYDADPCTTGTPTPIATASPTGTTPAATATATGTTGPGSPTLTPLTSTPVPTGTACTIAFSDVQTGDYFYEPVRYLFCLGAVSGYSDGTFRPYNNTTRGQLSKIVVLAERWTIDTTGGPHFTDVQSDNAFYDYIETAYNHGVISGYADGTFRWGTNVTRAQLTKIVVSAEAWTIDTTGGPHFADVPTTDPFYGYVETAYNHGIISGYADGAFRPGNSATRGQICKIVYSAVTGTRGR